jgi:hypothetical protein
MKGGNYLGTPSTYHSHYYERAISKNTLLFSPMGSSSPDHDGGQTRRWANTQLSKQTYPVAERVGSFSGQHVFNGQVIHFEDSGQWLVASGEASLAYDPDNVISYIRDFVHLKPDVFLIRDRYRTSNVATIRSIIHSRNKPIWGGAQTVIQGSASAGIIEAIGDSFRIQNGGSEAGIKVLWPPNPKLRFVGGAGYEGFADDYNTDPYTDCQGWLKGTETLTQRVELIEGQWRTEIETVPDHAEGQMIVSIVVDRTTPTESSQYSLSQDFESMVVVVTRNHKSRTVVFPTDDVPRVIGTTRESDPGHRKIPQPPFKDDNLNSE